MAKTFNRIRSLTDKELAEILQHHQNLHRGTVSYVRAHIWWHRFSLAWAVGVTAALAYDALRADLRTLAWLAGF